MKNEFEIFYDKELSKKVDTQIEFEPVVAGESTKKFLYLKNNILYAINYEIILEGINVTLDKSKGIIKPNSVDILELTFNPKLTAMVPINVKLKIKINYLVS